MFSAYIVRLRTKDHGVWVLFWFQCLNGICDVTNLLAHHNNVPVNTRE
jgi:hypothetical protein